MKSTSPPVLAQVTPFRAPSPASGLPPAGTIGAILVGNGRLSAANAERIAAHQEQSGLAFGEAGLALGLLKPDDLRFALSRQFALPCLQPDDPAIDPEVKAAFHPSDPQVEQLRHLRGQIMLRWLDGSKERRIVAMVGAERGSGRSYVAANLAVVFAQLGQRTLLIDADLVAPRQHTLFRLPTRHGLSTYLAGRIPIERAIHAVPAFPGLFVLPAGVGAPNPHDLLARPVLRQLFDFCARQSYVVIVDTPPWSAGSGTRMIAATAGAAVLLVRAGRSHAYETRMVTQELANANVNVLGIAFNEP